ncbi:MAG: endolytic transglycosylase MltG, partial [Dongiaceae bacterium]
MGWPLFKIFVAVVVLVLAGAGAYAYALWTDFNTGGALNQQADIVIPKGTRISAIANLLAEAKVIDNPLAFEMGVRLTSGGMALKAGEYEFPPNISPRTVMRLMIEGKVVQHKVTIPEGLTVAEILDLLKTTPLLDGDVPAAPAEGTLLPETYLYLRDDTRSALVERMQHDMEALLKKLWAERDQTIPLTKPEEAVILASVVEKETGRKDERAHVASVFYNRMEKGMPLQSDPTVIFALTNGEKHLDRALTMSDLKTASP